MKEVWRGGKAYFLDILLVLGGVALAGTYAVLGILGAAPMTPWIFILVLLLLTLLNFPIFLKAFYQRKNLKEQERIALILWGGILVWYWVIAPTYFLLTVNVNSLQLRWTAFGFIWELPVVGGIFVGVCLLFFRRIREFLEGKQLEINIADLHARVSSYPLAIALLSIVFAMIGYGVGVIQLAWFAYLPALEQLKAFLNGVVLSFFLAVVYALLLGPVLGQVRCKIEEVYKFSQRSMHFTIRQKALVTSFFIVTGSFLLIDLVALKAFHQVIQGGVRDRMEQILQGTGVAGAALGKRGEVFVLPQDQGRVENIISKRNLNRIQSEEKGVLDDSLKNSKVVAFSQDKASGQTSVSVAYLTDFYSQLTIPLASFAMAELFILAFIFGMAGFATRVFSSALQKLTSIAKKAAEGKEIDIPIPATGDEIEDLSRAFQYFAKRTWAFERQLAGKAESYSRALSETTKQKEELQDSNLALEEQNRVLEEARIKEEALIESLGSGIIVSDRDGRIVRINRAAEQMLGWEEHELYGKFLNQVILMEYEDKRQLVQPEDGPIRKVLDTMDKVVGRYVYITKDGRRLPVEITISPFLFRGRLFGTVEVIRDLSEEREIDRVKRDFVSIASHQLRTPLTTISWYSEVLRARSLEIPDGKQKEYIEHIYRADQRMIRLVNALLNVTRLEAGTFPMRPESISLKEIIRDVRESLENKISTKKLVVEEVFEDNLPRVIADPTAVLLIFENLISNAVKYSSNGGRITVALTRSGEEHVLVMVTDSGPGIPKEQQMQVFTKFFRGDNVSSEEGTGLGLFIVKSLVDLSSGRIWFTSIEGKGTTFYFELPLNYLLLSQEKAYLSP